MAFEPTNAWDMRVLAASESTLGTTPNAAAAQALEAISCSLGPPELGNTRDKLDRHQGRGQRSAFVEGRVDPIPFTVEASVRSRTAADTVPDIAPLLKAAGLLQTVNGATSVVYTMNNNPNENSAFSPLSLYRILGSGTARYQAEQMRGGLVKRLNFSGGDKELIVKADGEGLGKYHLGYAPSITLANGVVTSLSFASVEESYRFSLGWYIVESEIILIQSVNYSAGTAVIARGQLGSMAAAHAAQPLYPYVPTLTYAGSPISEQNVTCTLDSQTLRVLNFSFDVSTGGDFLPGESGSKYRQGTKWTRYDVTGKLRLVLHREDVALLGKHTQRKSVAYTLVCGTGAGSIVTFSMPQTEIEVGPVPDTANDVAIVDVTVKGKDSTSGNDMLTITLT